jgi:hypothetical protein
MNEIKHKSGYWFKGNFNDYYFEAKIALENQPDGINGGPIIKMAIYKNDEKYVYDFERGDLIYCEISQGDLNGVTDFIIKEATKILEE